MATKHKLCEICGKQGEIIYRPSLDGRAEHYCIPCYCLPDDKKKERLEEHKREFMRMAEVMLRDDPLDRLIEEQEEEDRKTNIWRYADEADEDVWGDMRRS